MLLMELQSAAYCLLCPVQSRHLGNLCFSSGSAGPLRSPSAIRCRRCPWSVVMPASVVIFAQAGRVIATLRWMRRRSMKIPLPLSGCAGCFEPRAFGRLKFLLQTWSGDFCCWRILETVSYCRSSAGFSQTVKVSGQGRSIRAHYKPCY